MKRLARSVVDRLAGGSFYDFVKASSIALEARIPELTGPDLEIIERVRPFTMTSHERIWACMQAARYVSARGLAGDFVECGVWRGGSSMAAALSFLAAGDATRRLWLFDTFEGMTRPADADIAFGSNAAAGEIWERLKRSDRGSDWCWAGIDEVRNNLLSVGYPAELIRFVRGPVEETLLDPVNLPNKIALLRLDTDWYESTRIELETLFDRLVIGGVMIIDDYGYWAGARKAVDEFMQARGTSYLLHRIDRSGRMMVKV